MVFFYESGERHAFESRLVTYLDHIVSQVIAVAKLPGGNRRAEVARELRAHLEDLAEEARSNGYDQAATTRIVKMRFGDPQEVAAAMASVYAGERLVKCMLQSTIMVIASIIAVSFVIATIQLIAALCTAASIALSFRGIHSELLGFATLTAGYCSVYAGERLFPTRLPKAVLPSATLGLAIAGLFVWLIPQHAALPLAAFMCAACGRLLQRVEIPFVWFAGTALPLLLVWMWFGPLLSGSQFPWLVWLGVTISCKALREIVRLFEKVFIEDFAG